MKKKYELGFVFYSPYGKKINKKTYFGASKILKKKGHFSKIVISDDVLKFVSFINEASVVCNKVLAVSHCVVSIEPFGNVLKDNVYLFLSPGMNKTSYFNVLKKNNIAVPDWLIYPKNIKEVFQKLGDMVVSKPNEYVSYGGTLVRLITPASKINNVDRWLYTKYVGKTKPPFIKIRVVVMFGEILFYYEVHNYREDGHIVLPDWVLSSEKKSIKVKKTSHKKAFEIASKVSKLMSKEFDCGMVGIDMVIDDNNKIWVVEANPTTVALNNINVEKLDKRINRKESIAHACLKQLLELN